MYASELAGSSGLDKGSGCWSDLLLFPCKQYGGSGAHAAVFKHQRGDWQAATRVRDKLISLRRAINNGWYDDEKQGAINLFLGHYQPCLGQSELWNLDSDHYLHSGVLEIKGRKKIAWSGEPACIDPRIGRALCCQIHIRALHVAWALVEYAILPQIDPMMHSSGLVTGASTAVPLVKGVVRSAELCCVQMCSALSVTPSMSLLLIWELPGPA